VEREEEQIVICIKVVVKGKGRDQRLRGVVYMIKVEGREQSLGNTIRGSI